MVEPSRRKIPTRDEVAYAKVKGVDIILDNDIWTNVPLLPVRDDTIKVHLRVEGFNRIHAYRSFVTFYPYLVRVFYYDFKFRDEFAYTKVKGVDIILDNDIWTIVPHLPVRDNTYILELKDSTAFLFIDPS
ncbi:hypothetical protein LR48_Vigan01g141400 [Vigna angularis]|uniref:Uncharacterized protein n=1 Tax=Phaseolus angularis TaxID=3914 RepID=A0A0L9TMP4_PHAAN|nr:hypothetical protein LR48_Vigan01g141400 [Vigna angularis]